MRPVRPTPAGMYFALVGSAALFGAIVCGGLVLLAGLAVLPSATPWVDVVRLSAVLFGLLLVASMVAALVVVRRVLPLYRALARAVETGGEEAPPPSQAALRDGFEAPRWMARVTGIFLVGAIALHAGGLLVFPHLLVGARLRFDMMASGWLALGILPAGLAWRRALWAWLGRVAPADVPRSRRGSVARRLRLAVGLPVLAIALALGAVLLGHLAPGVQGPSAFAGVPAAALGVLVAGVLVGLALTRRLGGALRADLRAVTARIDAAVGPGPAADRRERPAPGPRLPEVAELVEQVDALAERHVASVAEEARARRAIEQVQQLKSRFMAYMSHDLRSPLNSIKGFAEVLARGTDGPLAEAQLESVEMIRESGDVLLRLVNDILDSAKLEAGELMLARRWTPSVEIVTEAVRQAAEIVGRRPIRIATELEPGLPPAFVDRERVVQAVVGIVAHVLRPLEEGTIRMRARVRPGVEEGDRLLRLEVIDDSAALAREDRERLFEAFRALREPSGRRIGGLGLGLSLARGLVAAHGGDVWCERLGDKGTAFCVSLPLTIGEGA